ncbi:Uncharacterised protein [Mycobacteroides abscessus subsp. abscessus]|nr:Uncharacterised protein [Mycobacteroides abscessus subsp. abscessus]
MRCGGRVDDKRTHITDVGDLAVQGQGIDEGGRSLDTTVQFECEHGTGSLGGQGLRALVPWRCG